MMPMLSYSAFGPSCAKDAKSCLYRNDCKIILGVFFSRNPLVTIR